jgi:hypothetical protein
MAQYPGRGSWHMKTHGFQEQKIRGEHPVFFFICHHGCDKGGFSIEH